MSIDETLIKNLQTRLGKEPKPTPYLDKAARIVIDAQQLVEASRKGSRNNRQIYSLAMDIAVASIRVSRMVFEETGAPDAE